MRPALARCIGCLCLASSTAAANHIAREDPPEPIFTERAFIENDLELDIRVDRDASGDILELSPAFTWIFFERLQLGAEIPIGWWIPSQGAHQVALSDVGLSAKWLFCCDSSMGFESVSTRLDVAPPTGDRLEGIGGTGELTVSLLGGYGLTVVRAFDDLSIQAQLAWTQQLRSAAGSGTTEKGLLWNVALSQPFFSGRFVPTLEALGTTVVDADAVGDERTRFDLAVGFQLRPVPDDHWASPLTISAGWRFPVADRGDFRGSGLISLEWAFD